MTLKDGRPSRTISCEVSARRRVGSQDPLFRARGRPDAGLDAPGQLSGMECRCAARCRNRVARRASRSRFRFPGASIAWRRPPLLRSRERESAATSPTTRRAQAGDLARGDGLGPAHPPGPRRLGSTTKVVAAGEAARASRLAHNKSAICRLSTRPSPASALDIRQRATTRSSGATRCAAPRKSDSTRCKAAQSQPRRSPGLPEAGLCRPQTWPHAGLSNSCL